MNNKDNIYIFGHRNPDTDSVAGAIAFAYLKKRQGMECVPAVLSSVNLETSYALNYFKVEVPVFLNDVKIKIRDLDYVKKFSVTEDNSLNDAYFKMLDAGISKIPVVTKNNKLRGLITMKDIAHGQFTNDIDFVKTSYNNILKTIDGEELLRFDDDIEGKLLVASYKTSTIKENINLTRNHILVVGDRHDIIKYAIRSGVKMLIITGPNTIIDRHLELAKKNKVNIINTKYNTIVTARRFYLANNLSTIPYKKEILSIHDYDNVSDFMNMVNKTRYNYYPVLDDKEKCIGILKISDVNYDNKQKVILIDHNNYEQSAVGLDEAEILEIVDHHNIGSIGTNMPINFRNMPVGSTNTILYVMYEESNIKIPKKIAGLMLSGILSDTLILTSPTTTKMDIKAVRELAEIADIDYKEYGYNMLRAGSSLKGKTKEEVLYTDFKNYPVGDFRIGLGQFSTTDPDEILKHKDGYVKLLNNVADGNNYHFVCLFVTDIINKGSYVLFSERAHDILCRVYKKDSLEEGTFLKGIVSRKKQVLPGIMLEME